MRRTLKIPSGLQTRAAFEPSTYDAEKGTVDLTWTTGARGLRRTWGGSYYEELEVSETAVDLSRMNNGASVLNAHSSWDVKDVIGVVERAWIKDGAGHATVRFSDREDVKPIRADVQNGILRHVSVGYSVEKYEEVEKVDGVPVYRATRWTPAEISLVPVAFDDGAVVRSRIEPESYEVEIVTRGADAPEEETHMSEKTETTAAPAAQPDNSAAIREAAVAEERARVTGIQQAVRAAKLGDDVAAKMIADGTPLEKARAAVLELLAAKDDAVKTESHVRIEGGTEVRREAIRSGMSNALLHRLNPGSVKLEEVGREFRNMSLLRMAEETLEAAGVKTRGMAPMEIAGFALGIRGHSTSDFPLILADVANKTMRQAYQEAPQTFAPIARRTTLPDFKEVKRTQLGEAPKLEKVIEGAEFARGTIGEGREKYALSTYGKVFAITRQALVNDDMDAFSRIPALFGRSARDLESDVVWEQITANAAMADGVPLFHADHGNIAASGAAISVATLGAGRAAMRKQKGIGKKQYINVQAKYLIVPAALETIAEQFVSSNLLANVSGSINPFAGKLQVIAEPRLDANSATAWYLAADPGQIDMIEYGYLLGEEGPALETRVGFDVDGLEIKCRHDFAAKVIDYRGFYKNAGG